MKIFLNITASMRRGIKQLCMLYLMRFMSKDVNCIGGCELCWWTYVMCCANLQKKNQTNQQIQQDDSKH